MHTGVQFFRFSPEWSVSWFYMPEVLAQAIPHKRPSVSSIACDWVGKSVQGVSSELPVNILTCQAHPSTKPSSVIEVILDLFISLSL